MIPVIPLVTRLSLPDGRYTRTLVNGVERLEVEDLDTGMGLGRIEDETDDTVDSVLILHMGSIGSQLDDVVDRERTVSPDGLAIDGELVGGEGTGLVRTQDGNGSQLFNGGGTGDNSLVPRELLSAGGGGGGRGSQHGGGDTTNQEDEDVVEIITV